MHLPKVFPAKQRIAIPENRVYPEEENCCGSVIITPHWINAAIEESDANRSVLGLDQREDMPLAIVL